MFINILGLLYIVYLFVLLKYFVIYYKNVLFKFEDLMWLFEIMLVNIFIYVLKFDNFYYLYKN